MLYKYTHEEEVTPSRACNNVTLFVSCGQSVEIFLPPLIPALWAKILFKLSLNFSLVVLKTLDGPQWKHIGTML